MAQHLSSEKTPKFNGVKVISATMVADRMELGERATRWIAEAKATRKGFELDDMVITQSSDQAFHCVAITIFYFEIVAPVPAGTRRVG